MWEPILFSLLCGVGGTGAGGLIVSLIRNARESLSALVNFAAGLMLAVVSFDMLPASVKLSGLYPSAMAVAIGIGVTALIDMWLARKLPVAKRAGALMGIAIALHNFPEGLAIGSSFQIEGLGISVCLIVALHDLPEGLAMAAPMRLGGTARWKTVFYAALSGVPTVLGAVVGQLAATVNDGVVGLSIAGACGAMLYITFGRMLPDGNTGGKGLWALLLGITAGFLITYGL